MNRDRVIFIDDEPFFAEPYVRELSKNFDVTYFEDIVEAANAIAKRKTCDAIVLDIMMPHPESVSSDYAIVLDTGLWFLSRAILTLDERHTPVLILTNRNLPHVQEAVDRLITQLSIRDGIITVRPKIETPRFILSMIIKSLIDRFREV